MSQLPSTEWQSDLQRDRAAAADLSLSNLDVFPREPRVRGPAARRVRVAERLRSKPPPIERVPVLAPGLRPRVQVPWPAERSSLPRPELRPVPQELGRHRDLRSRWIRFQQWFEAGWALDRCNFAWLRRHGDPGNEFGDEADDENVGAFEISRI